MIESAQVANSAQGQIAQSSTQQRPPGTAPKAAAGVSSPAPVRDKQGSPPAETGTIAPGTVRVTGVTPSRPSVGFPDCATSGPEVWRPFFAKTSHPVRAVQRHVMYLSDQKQHEHIIALLNAAIIEGQAQPWMYEVLAVTMETAKYPKDEVERVVLSVADFGNATYESMMYSGAYLSNFGRAAAALRMYRQAARMAPDRPEPYALSLKLANQTGVADDAIWAACGVLRHAWGADHQYIQEQAELLLNETEQQLRKAKSQDQLAHLQELTTTARRRDLRVRLQWNGTADLDLSVEDPAGGVSSFEVPESVGGGYLLTDGFGPKNCQESYVCPVGFSGKYVLRVKKSSGKIVGERAVLTIITHAGSRQEITVQKTIQFDMSNEQILSITLQDGRREERRATSIAAPAGVARDWERVAGQVGRPTSRTVDRETRSLVSEMRNSRQQGALPARGGNGNAGNGFGAIGFAPTISIIPEGTSLAVQAVVSPDRRYVRMALSPSFSSIIDVAVFSFQGPNSGTTSSASGR